MLYVNLLSNRGRGNGSVPAEFYVIFGTRLFNDIDPNGVVLVEINTV